MVSRRTMLLAPLTPLAISVVRGRHMTLSVHQNTSAAAGYRKSLEGWAKA